MPARPPIAWRVLIALAGTKLLGHLTVALITPYELHRDELLYLALGQRLRFWAMDVPPKIAVVANAATATFGDSLFAVRFAPAIIGTAVLMMAVLLARELGGGRLAQSVAGLAILVNPLFLRSATLLQPVVLDQFCWALGLLAIVRIIRSDSVGWWVVLGVSAGLGLLSKLSIVFFGTGVAAAMLLTPQRREYLTFRPYGALLVALLVGSATIVGQMRLGWPVFAQIGALQASQLDRITPVDFLSEQLLYGPATLLGWLGLGALLFAPRLRPFRVIGGTGLVVLLLLMAMQGKGYYFGPMYPALFAAGGVALEQIGRRKLYRTLPYAAVVLIVLYLPIAVPVGMPILQPEAMASYARTLGMTPALQTNTGGTLPLPQDFADMLGWNEMVDEVSRVYHALPPDEQQAAVIAAANTAEAAASDFYGVRSDLRPASAVQPSSGFFVPATKPGDVLIAVGMTPDDLDPHYDHVELLGRHTNRWAVDEERDVPVYKATGPAQTLQELWPSLGGRF